MAVVRQWRSHNSDMFSRFRRKNGLTKLENAAMKDHLKGRSPCLFKSTALVSLVRDAVTLQEAGQPDVTISADLPSEPILADVDDTMISQALTNLVKNAGEAIETLKEKSQELSIKPEIRIAMQVLDEEAVITIQDNGVGLPEDRAKLFEPYVTTRDKGTGLGLPIVKKIIEEHGGTLTLSDAETFDGNAHFGAMATIKLPTVPAGSVANKIPA